MPSVNPTHKKRDPKVVSYTMSRIRGKDTSIELRLRHALWSKGLRYRKNYKRAPGSPDIAFPSKKLAVFCDSSFWHGRDWSEQKKRLKTNREFWIKKIEANRKRDKKVNKDLETQDWKVLRFWDYQIEKDLENCVEIIASSLTRN